MYSLLVNSHMIKTPWKATVHVFPLPIYYSDAKYARIYVTRIMLSSTIEGFAFVLLKSSCVRYKWAITLNKVSPYHLLYTPTAFASA